VALTWDPEAGVYRDADGDAVALAVVQTALERIIADARVRLAVLGQQRAEGDERPGWEQAVQATLRAAHVAAAALAVGGAAQVEADTEARLEARLAVQFGYLAAFVAAVPAAAFEAAAMARLALYADAVWGTFEAERRQQALGRGEAFERNVLGTARHCAECPELSDQGWVPVGTLPLPGDRQCITRCHCWLEYGDGTEEAA
jgi:hypothetical protein